MQSASAEHGFIFWHSSFIGTQRPWNATKPSLQAHMFTSPSLPGVHSVALAPHAFAPVHMPSLQLSPVVQLLASSHTALVLRASLMQAPVLGSQAPMLHASALPVQSGSLPPLQVPPTHLSSLVHPLPSSQVASLFWLPQPVGSSQLSSVQGLPSSYLVGSLLSSHLPFLHVPSLVQA